VPVTRVARPVLLLVLLAAIVALALLLVTRGRDRRLDEWIGRQLVGIVNAYLVPRLDFASLRYEPPLTVRLTGVSLVAPDQTRVLDVSSLVIALAEVPRLGQPIRIARLEVTGGRVNLIRVPAAEDRPAGFKGLSPLVKGDRGSIDPNYRLSNVLRLERVAVRDGVVRYDPADGSGVMELPNLALDMGISRAADYAEPGWYALDLDSGRSPGALIRARGAFNIDTLAADLTSTSLTIDVSPQTIGTLPPAVQQVLRDHDARGRLSLQASGRLEPDNLDASRMEATLELDGFNVAFGEFRFPIERAAGRAVLSSGVLDLESLDIDAIRGRIRLTGSMNLSDASRPASGRWNAEALDLRELLRAQGPEGRPPRLAGVLTAEGQARAELSRLPDSISGRGWLRVRDGRLVMLPGLTQLAEALNVGAQLLGAGQLSHRADIEFELTPPGVRVTASTIEAEFLAARATGRIAYDGTLDLDVNAGPLEKLQANLGGVGRIFGRITDQLVTYHVTGPMNNPSVRVAPLGIK
jgi:hypothetical protein